MTEAQNKGYLNTSTLMLIDENGEEVVHILDDPKAFPSLTKLGVPEEIKEVVGTDLDEVNVHFAELSKDGDTATYVVLDLPYWVVTLCRERGMLWGRLKSPMIH